MSGYSAWLSIMYYLFFPVTCTWWCNGLFPPPLSKASLMLTNNKLFLRLLIFLSKVYDNRQTYRLWKASNFGPTFWSFPRGSYCGSTPGWCRCVDKPILQTGREYFRNFCGTNCFRFLEQRSNKDGVTDGAKAGRKTRGSLARSARLISGSARLGSAR